MTGYFSTSHEVKITFKISELNVTVHISASFHVKAKKGNYNVIFGRDLLQELKIQLDFQNNFVRRQDITLPMKPVNYK